MSSWLQRWMTCFLLPAELVLLFIPVCTHRICIQGVVFEMVKNTITRYFFGAGLVVAMVGLAHGMASRPAPTPVPMKFVRAASEPEAAAIAIEWVVPRIDTVGPLDRLELLILDPDAKPLFGAMQVLGDNCDPVPPGAFGVILDPAKDDRSIRNVASAGQNGQWDQATTNGTLLKQSVSGVVGGNLGIAFWIVPKQWKPGRHLILARAVRKKSKPEQWRNLATLDLADDGKTVISNWGIVRPVFHVVGADAPMSMEDLGSVTLIRYERREQSKGTTVQRWKGDTASRDQYVEIDRRELNSADLPEGILSLQSGVYQFKHNSVSGRPPSGYYGESPVFEIKPEQKAVEIHVQLYPAI